MHSENSSNQRLLLWLLFNSALFVTLYFVGVHFAIPMEIIYVAAGAVLGLYYVIYNKGFSGKGVTPDMLPATMTMEEKLAFIEDSKTRLRKSKWVLTILFPIILAVAIDLIRLFLLPQLQGCV